MRDSIVMTSQRLSPFLFFHFTLDNSIESIFFTNKLFRKVCEQNHVYRFEKLNRYIQNCIAIELYVKAIDKVTFKRSRVIIN